MTKEDVLVYVNNKKVSIYRGMQVKHALIAHDYSLFKAVEEGRVAVVDENGFTIGLDGSLQDGAKLFVRERRQPAD
jgi:hypothetical protein